MTDEKSGTGGTRRLFQLGENYGEVGPGLGCLYEAWRVDKGRPALMLRPGDGVEWQPEGPWRVCISCDPKEDSVTLEVKQAPAAAQLMELANLLVLMTAAVGRVEDNAQVQAHLARGPVTLAGPWSSRARWSWSVPALASVAVFALGLGVGLSIARESPLPNETVAGMASKTVTLTNAPYVIASSGSDAGIIAYPMPAGPFANQEPTPCKAQRGEVAINGGCWIEVAQRPPCLADTHAEYQGRCYLPVAKRARLPQSVEPSGQ
ncbi:hypothetical protein D187_001486 [Cystobacter fuscus DSM 2262]|uniref:Protein kinase n=1 Tax=Cystobacter fuscus (strain ATCC 25194 / DSM 2262 / NBRC 100088 / M29) TaxID=1242864 RepID=S9P8Q9_CYSF2|nr:hypothetical protein [Cystobacter fuscus]EPX60835.1 hypothetical protein D187_001486 [Cystobacter fuscus DSM 2262]